MKKIIDQTAQNVKLEHEGDEAMNDQAQPSGNPVVMTVQDTDTKPEEGRAIAEVVSNRLNFRCQISF
jgi:hypothetical protein